MSPETLIQHLAEEEHVLGAVTPPIFQNSLFVFESVQDFIDSSAYPKQRKLHNYSRLSNPTLEVVEQKIAALEHLEACKVFGSGMGAISCALLGYAQSGSHIVALDTCYGPTRQFICEFLPRFGITHTLVEGTDPEEVLGALRPETTVVYLESPGSIIFRMQDLEAICTACRERGITTIMDNSYSSPYFQTPADFGVDVVVHSASKYLGGHSDIVAGVLATSTDRMRALMASEVPLLGAILAPFPAWLLLRGLRTLPIRMNYAQESGNAVAQWLDSHAQVTRVFHPGLESHPGRALVTKHMRGTGALLSFEPAFQEREQIVRFLESLKVYQMGVSWGGFESLAVAVEMEPMGWPNMRWVIRLYCGLESVEDLIADLDQAFRATAG